jgi:hypothetical protein
MAEFHIRTITELSVTTVRNTATMTMVAHDAWSDEKLWKLWRDDQPRTFPEGYADRPASAKVCEDCGGRIESQDYADISYMRYRQFLCKSCMAAKRKR